MSTIKQRLDKRPLLASPETRTRGWHPAARRAEARLRELAQTHLRHCRVWLFGSRAQGQAWRRSDFDLAFRPRRGYADSESHAFLEAVAHDPEIFYAVELVHWRDASAALRKNILQGIAWIK
jgi:predicted nucleotidyltransferase